MASNNNNFLLIIFLIVALFLNDGFCQQQNNNNNKNSSEIEPMQECPIGETAPKFPIIDTVERQTGMDREQLFYTVVALLTFYLLFGSYNIFVSNVLVKSYPVYQNVMTIRSQSKADDTQWLAYWCAFALFSLVDHFIAQFGPYLLLKTAVLVYMLLPQTYGAHNCFVNYVQPMMERFAERRARRHAH
ncbi:hypothetical protein niasHT_009633 [Heterodera trifolii]|uniref:Receptor expression-enhancing protein n=1 Tax=Heterodera trifolii TaxID=157864 RepID=A0ABD2LWR7_9BILA